MLRKVVKRLAIQQTLERRLTKTRGEEKHLILRAHLIARIAFGNLKQPDDAPVYAPDYVPDYAPDYAWLIFFVSVDEDNAHSL